MGIPYTPGTGGTISSHQVGGEDVPHHSAYAHTTGGWTPYSLVSANTTNATSVKGSAGQIGYWSLGNSGSAPAYLKLYDKATAPTVGTDAPVHTVLIPGGTDGGGNNLAIPAGLAFSNGIAFALTANPEAADTTAVPADEITVNLGYK